MDDVCFHGSFYLVQLSLHYPPIMLPPKIIIIMLPSIVSHASFAELERQPKDERRSRKETSAKIKKNHRQPRET